MDIKELTDIAQCFYDCTAVPVTVFNDKMEIVAETGRDMKICKFFDIYNTKGSCMKVLKFSGEMAYSLGEPYIYSCPAGFVNICVALISDKKFQGCLIAGPLSMNTINEKNINAIMDLNKNSSGIAGMFSKLSLFIKDMPIYTPANISSLSRLFFNNLLSLYSNREDYLYLSNKYNTHSQISETIKKHKAERRLTPEAIYQSNSDDRIRQLLRRIQAGDHNGARDLINMILEEILITEAGNFEIMKIRLFELYMSLSRAGVESGASIQKVFGIHFDLIASLTAISTLPELHQWTLQVVDHFIDNVFSTIYSGHSQIISNAIQHINTNYMTKINLKNLADLLHVNESYLSKLFKQEMGKNFTDYLNEIRINKSLSLIRDTDNNLLDIAIAVGFEDQSYYTKIFRKVMGTTPKHYRNGSHPASAS